jgi:CubicO group peptidase (beta-lactamase class C family)
VGFAATPVIAQSGFLKTRFDSLDANKDGKISLSEAPRPGMVLLNDVDKDRALSPSEFETLMNRIVDGTAASKGNEEPWKAAKFAGEIPADASITKASVLAAAKYSAENRGISFLVMYDGELIYADYPNGGAIERAHELASGTKSFTGVTAIAAIEDGIIESLDEKVCDTITAWKTDPMKSQITVRHLLTLTCGLTPESSDGRQVPRFASAIENKALAKPGDTFAYGPVPFQCFGEFLRLKLIARGLDESPLDYMNRRIFRPIGLEYGAWRMDEDGNPNLPSGAQLTATDWAKFGELIRLGGTWEGNEIVPLENLDQCLAGSDANPAYGFTFWLNQPVAQQFRRTNRQLRFATDDMTGSDVIPSDLIFAAGAGKQRLLISRDAKLVVVRQASGIVDSLNGKRDTFSDRKFMTRLMK